ncbi:CheR family methyltransferase [Chondrinema litorale]|uniref:CheR family methyltransferase n=1 Tax=Chondrinema litorale TaxID=2994555 RepID=UPI002543D8FA|nr:CheR family methyltransferase [Chondrinema litorale]UZR98216.1 PAS domain-containing protein [Chondrinema litorale]
MKENKAAKETNLKDNKDNFPIVGIGASAGGLEALKEFFANMPESSGIAFVIIQHLSPDFKSMMPELLGKHTNMKITTAQNGQVIQPNKIYLIPVKKNIIIKDRKLFLMEKENSVGPNLPIDLFFNSLGNVLEEKSVGIILSGTGTDGSRGIKMIKEAGGMIMVQDPDTSKFDGMPNAAISTGMVDLILPPRDMGEKLVAYFSGKTDVLKEFENLQPSKGSNSYLDLILFKVKKVSGIDFSAYKKPTILRRIEKNMKILHFSSLIELDHYLIENPDEVKKLYKEFLIGVTSFFRDPEAFESLKSKVFPEIVKNKTTNEPIRIWSAGCSTGEETYSLAFIMLDFFETHALYGNIRFKIFASDIDRDALERASTGIYNSHQLANLPTRYISKYFNKLGENQFQVKDFVRKNIVFAKHNIIKDPPFIRLDLVVCRNLLIYIEPHIQKKTLLNFQFALNPGGYLFLGSSESTSDVSQEFEVVDKKWKIYTSRSNRKPLERYNQVYDEISSRIQAVDNSVTNPGVYQKGFKKNIFEEILVQQFSPNCVFVDKDYNIQYIHGKLNTYLSVPQKEPIYNILKMTSEEVSLTIRNGIRRALNEDKRISYKKIPFNFDDKDITLQLHFQAYDVGKHEKYILIVFEEGVIGNVKGLELEYTNDIEDKRVQDLENELDTTRQELQSALEELETSNEELQAANEELLASNEELQSTNEELQSVNEELITVNSELQYKIKAVEEANNDVNNLLSSTEIGTILLDKDACLRKFNMAASHHFNLVESDTGRPIYHFHRNFRFDDFQTAVNDVIDGGKKVEKEIFNNGEYYLLRILPYKISDNEIDGVVLTFIEITELKAAQKLLENSNAQLIRSNEYLDSFVYTAAHDLRAPLVNAKNLLNLFNMVNGEKQKEVQQNLIDSVNTLENTLNGLIEIIDTQKNDDIKADTVKFEDIYKEVEIKLKSQITESNADINISFNKAKEIVYNRPYLMSIMQNLISNAIKYRSYDRKTVVHISTKKDGDYICLVVKDNGIGMDMKVVGDKLFKPFKRFHEEREGKGIGLNIIKNMIEKNSGKIKVESYPGLGTEFFVYLKPY